MTHGPSPDGYAIQYVSNSAGADIAAGASLSGFGFTSPDSPSVLAGNSPAYPTFPVLTATVYQNGPFSGATEQFVVQFASVPEPSTLTLGAIGLFGIRRLRRSPAKTCRKTRRLNSGRGDVHLHVPRGARSRSARRAAPLIVSNDAGAYSKNWRTATAKPGKISGKVNSSRSLSRAASRPEAGAARFETLRRARLPPAHRPTGIRPPSQAHRPSDRWASEPR